MPRKTSTDELARRGAQILRQYLQSERRSTDRLKELAEVVVELRSRFQLDDGRTDWSGRSYGYREAMGYVYRTAGVPTEELDTLQAALRYHVGNLLRERVARDELEEAGLTREAPRERHKNARDIVATLERSFSPGGAPEDVQLVVAAEALLERVDVERVSAVAADKAVAMRIALEMIQKLSVQLLEGLPAKATRRGSKARLTA